MLRVIITQSLFSGSPASAAESNVETSGNLTDDPHGDSQESGPWPHRAGTAAGST